QIIKVAAGQTFAERIVIDESFPRGIRIVAEPGPAPVLAPPGGDPIVTVRSGSGRVEGFRLEGFRLDATGKDVAIELTDWTIGAELKGLEITGFQKAGVHFNGAQTFQKEDERIVVTGTTFQSPVPEAVGIRISAKEHDSGYIRVNKCRFLGPLESGILVECDMRWLEVSESIFTSLSHGIRFAGAERGWFELSIVFNTFYQNDRAIVFMEMPATRSRGFQFHNNLFLESRTVDMLVEKGYKAADFYLMYATFPAGSGYNWTTRPPTTPPNPDELIAPFETTGGRRGVGDLQFLSVDPVSPDFLAPTPDAPQRQAGNLLDKKPYGTHVGAVRPKP
ncbi:MAG: hypothetical protein JSS02_31155, partial [Planctomycetes bacterium]|nr:hypothetical protein [Planctomycetota bacterium]